MLNKIRKVKENLDDEENSEIVATSGGKLSKNGVKQVFHVNFNDKNPKKIKKILSDLFEKAAHFESLSIYYPKFNLYDDLFNILLEFLKNKKDFKLKEIIILFDERKSSEIAKNSLENLKSTIYLESEELQKKENSEKKKDFDNEEKKINEIYSSKNNSQI